MFHGTIVDEEKVLAVCLARLHLGERQVVRSMTRGGLQVLADERVLSYLREHFEGLEEGAPTDFLAKNREQYPVGPDLNPGGRLICVGDKEFEPIFRDRDGWARFRLEFPESDGTLRFSPVGLDQDATQAMLYAGQQFDWNVGSGGFWLFPKPEEWETGYHEPQLRKAPSSEKSLITITDADSPSQLDAVRDLMRAFMAWHRERHTQDLHLIDAYFDAASFEEELATLPGAYSPPSGHLLLASYEGEPVGCVALRPLDAQFCEMKRMFVYSHMRGRGIGLALAQRIIEDARSSGYRAMRLDTSIRQAEAEALYSRLGFNVIPPYYELPADLRDWLVFMELTL